MIKAVLFDFDGVLVNSHESTIAYFQETFRHFNLPIPPKEAFLPILGLRTIDMLKQLLPAYSEEQMQPIFDFNKQMSVKYADQITLIPDALQTLQQLKKKYKLALITSRGKTTVSLLLKNYDLGKYFQVVIDREDITLHKPHPFGILKAIEALDVTSEETVYIGDMEVDAQAAKNAHVKSIIITHPDQEHYGDFRVSNLSEIPELVKAL